MAIHQKNINQKKYCAKLEGEENVNHAENQPLSLTNIKWSVLKSCSGYIEMSHHRLMPLT